MLMCLGRIARDRIDKDSRPMVRDRGWVAVITESLGLYSAGDFVYNAGVCGNIFLFLSAVKLVRLRLSC